jgi:bifunctional non-homologous end joining protein LigD
VLDGEVVVLDELGRSDFERLHARSHRRGWYEGADAVVYVAWDVLVHRGADVRGKPLEVRKALLTRLLAKARPSVLLSQHVDGLQAPELYRMACDLKLKGIVLKRLGSTYCGGEPRTGDWVKVKRPGATPAERFTRDAAL